MYEQNKFFQISHQKIFQGREKMFHSTPERRLRQGSSTNEILDRSKETEVEIQKSTPRGLQESKPKLSAGTPGGEKIRHSDSDS
ncbi:hypothetical protein TNCV_1154661 [Trichonephila clavipes]|nr:hypothetical protein TNCV_1154661 [Trichonephila clavipes]